MKKYEVIAAFEAEQELNCIREEVTESLGFRFYGDLVTQRILEDLWKLEYFPAGHEKVDDIPGLYRMNSRKYAVFFTIDEKKARVNVVHILHARRNLSALLVTEKNGT